MALSLHFSSRLVAPLQRNVRGLHVNSTMAKESTYKFLICGGGTGGLAVASSLARRFGENQVAVIDPSDVRMHELNMHVPLPTTN